MTGLDRSDRQSRAQMIGRGCSADSHMSNRVVLIVDDCRIRRDFLFSFLAENGADVLLAWDVDSLCAEIHGHQPDVILLSAASRPFHKLLERAVALGVASRLVVFGLLEDAEAEIVSCAEFGVAGYHLQSQPLPDLLTFARQVASGESGCPAKVAALLLRRLSELAASQRPEADTGALTAREEEVLQMLERGLSNRQIALRLGIATHTVKNHVHNLLTKLGARSRGEAVARSRGGMAPSRQASVHSGSGLGRGRVTV